MDLNFGRLGHMDTCLIVSNNIVNIGLPRYQIFTLLPRVHVNDSIPIVVS